MERLTTRNSEGVPVYKSAYECERCGEVIWRLPDLGSGSPTTRLCEYEEAASCSDSETETVVAEVARHNLKMNALAVLNNIAISAIFAWIAVEFQHWWIILFSLLCHSYTHSKSKK